MIDKEMQEYRTYQRFIRNLLISCGCWHVPTKFNKLKYCWSIYNILILIIYVLINITAVYKLRHNFYHMMNNFGVTISAAGAVIKVIIFFVNRKLLINYHRTLNNIFEEELERNEKIRRMILSSLHKISTVAYMYSLILVLLILGYSTPTFLFIIRGLCSFNLTTNYILPLTKGYGYFWTVPKNFLYHFYFLFEMSLVISSSCTASSVDNAFGFYVYQISSTLRAMTFRITNLLPNEKYTDVLKACVAKHQILQPCRDTLEHIYGPIIFWHVITNALLLCSLIYQAFLQQTVRKFINAILICAA
ncbi:hypothetical protein PUN28_016974 [Cardiocondyla obscurior]|uniref:Odorant receptor n=1 Tax=Cardiocondyla obscurior TaxID=286306 RepID=A0AAW2EJS9_9HYME